jgi:RimJ/RimL family protein N-acetyltransferase
VVQAKALRREGERVRLRPVQDGDLEDLVDAADDEAIARWTDLPHPYSREHGARFIALAEEEARVGKSFHLAIATIEADRLVGMAALSDVDLESHNAEIGIWLGREMWGEGVAFEAFDLLLEIAFDRLDLTKLYGVVLEGNKASIDLFKRYGFHEEGRLRWHTRRRGDWMDKIFFGLLREEWERRTGRA